MKKIQLHGKYSHLYALVDDKDFNEINQWKWYGVKDGKTFYAIATNNNGKFETIRLNRLILKLVFKNKLLVDHKDSNGLNNQRNNLRIVTSQQNQFNKNKQDNMTSIYKGVSWIKKNQK